jgi:hypothetical protein
MWRLINGHVLTPRHGRVKERCGVGPAGFALLVREENESVQVHFPAGSETERRVMNQFFEELGKRWVAGARRRDAAIEAPSLDPRVALELLELARVAARTRERRFAPLSCFMAGVAAERLRIAKPGLDPEAVADYINEIRLELEAETPEAPNER